MANTYILSALRPNIPREQQRHIFRDALSALDNSQPGVWVTYTSLVIAALRFRVYDAAHHQTWLRDHYINLINAFQFPTPVLRAVDLAWYPFPQPPPDFVFPPVLADTRAAAELQVQYLDCLKLWIYAREWMNYSLPIITGTVTSSMEEWYAAVESSVIYAATYFTKLAQVAEVRRGDIVADTQCSLILQGYQAYAYHRQMYWTNPWYDTTIRLAWRP